MDFWLSSEHRGLEVDRFYSNILGRTADVGGRDHWVKQLEAGMPEVLVAVAFVTSEEYRSNHPDNASFVRGLYRHLLDRDGADHEVAGWQQILQNGARSRAAVAYYFLSSPEAFQDAIDAYYSNFLDRRESPQEQHDAVVGLASLHMIPLSAAAVFLGSNEYLAQALRESCPSPMT